MREGWHSGGTQLFAYIAAHDVVGKERVLFFFLVSIGN